MNSIWRWLPSLPREPRVRDEPSAAFSLTSTMRCSQLVTMEGRAARHIATTVIFVQELECRLALD